MRSSDCVSCYRSCFLPQGATWNCIEIKVVWIFANRLQTSTLLNPWCSVHSREHADQTISFSFTEKLKQMFQQTNIVEKRQSWKSIPHLMSILVLWSAWLKNHWVQVELLNFVVSANSLFLFGGSSTKFVYFDFLKCKPSQKLTAFKVDKNSSLNRTGSFPNHCDTVPLYLNSINHQPFPSFINVRVSKTNR